jgi:phospholipid/cholesterol/gamma-HCH transport system substrate-binding protein
MNRRPSPSPFTNRILIGSITVLVLIVAVFLAYNANSGLPFVPTYNVNAQVPDAAGLLASDGVLIGGNRVGYVSSISSKVLPDGVAIAVLHLRLSKSVQALPADSTDLVRPVSPLGEKYLQITRGHSSQTLAAGATIPLSHTSLPVELDDFFKIFNQKTREASQTNLIEFGNGFAARGPALNAALATTKALVYVLLPVTSNLLNTQTRWAQLFPSLEQAAHEVAPVANQQAELFTALDETFTPLSQATQALQASIRGGPPSLRTATRELPAQAQFVNDSTELFRRFRPAFHSLGQASVQLAPAEAAGIPALRRSPQLNSRLVTTLNSIESFAQNPGTLPGLVLLTETAQLIKPTVAYIKPAQTQCNYLTLFFRNLESALSESDQVGTMLDAEPLALPGLASSSGTPLLPNSEAGPASAPANGPPGNTLKGLSPLQQNLVQDSFLHSNPYPTTGQNGVCMAGNERYVAGRKVIGHAPVLQNGTEQTKRVLP